MVGNQSIRDETGGGDGGVQQNAEVGGGSG